ncbi:MAG: TylF/MycF/NovP-related O-methyltransferase [bacterium]
MEKVLDFDFDKSWEYENGFYMTSSISRLSKMVAHYELYKTIVDLPGEVIECGVFKGASFIRLATFREILENSYSRKIIGFDAFGDFPETEREIDNEFIKKFEKEAGTGISKNEFKKILRHKNITNYELIQGNILKTIPAYLLNHPSLKISLLHIDVDVYKPTKIILEYLFERVVDNGLIVLDDYGKVEGETKAVDEFLKDNKDNYIIKKALFSHVPSYIKK